MVWYRRWAQCAGFPHVFSGREIGLLSMDSVVFAVEYWIVVLNLKLLLSGSNRDLLRCFPAKRNVHFLNLLGNTTSPTSRA